jgi:antirestriction protein ArdC
MDVYAIVTDKIINLLEQGVVPWRRPCGLPPNARQIIDRVFGCFPPRGAESVSPF